MRRTARLRLRQSVVYTRSLALVFAGCVAVAVACSLNPQPLPPMGPEGAADGDAGRQTASPGVNGSGGTSDAKDGSAPPASHVDAGSNGSGSDAGSEDAGTPDASDGGDAADACAADVCEGDASDAGGD